MTGDGGDRCGVCDYRSFCGSCCARADGCIGDMLAGDPGCVYNRHMWDEITQRTRDEEEMQHNLTIDDKSEVAENVPM